MGSFKRHKDKKQSFGFRAERPRTGFNKDSGRFERSEERGGFKKYSGGRSFRRDDDGPSERFEKPGFKKFGSKPFDRNERRPLEVHNVICDKCGKECDVPFKPTGNKPIYCRDCFRKNDGADSFSRPRFEPRRESGGSSDELSKINQKLDRIMAHLKIR